MLEGCRGYILAQVFTRATTGASTPPGYRIADLRSEMRRSRGRFVWLEDGSCRMVGNVCVARATCMNEDSQNPDLLKQQQDELLKSLADFNSQNTPLQSHPAPASPALQVPGPERSPMLA